jgi:IS4 transposase
LIASRIVAAMPLRSIPGSAKVRVQGSVPLRRVSYYAADIEKRFVFLSNNVAVPAPAIAALYHCRWQIEVFFKTSNPKRQTRLTGK